MALRLSIVFLLAALSAAAKSAPEGIATPATPPPAAETAPADADFQVGPGDMLQIEVWQEPAISGRFAIGRTGSVDYPLLGQFPAAGKTADEIATAMGAALRKGYVKNARVSVRVVDFHSFRVAVVGAVKQPGVFYLHGHSDLFSVILLAGGIDTQVPGIVSVVRGGEGAGPDGTAKVLTADLGTYLRTGDRSQNLTLQPDDLVFVPGVGSGAPVDPKRAITVVGEVKSPGVFEPAGGDTVLSVVLRAGGTTEFAARNGTRVYRGGDGAKAIDVKLADILEHGERKKDLALKPGDLVVVPARLF